MPAGDDPFATPRRFRDPARRLRGRLAAPVTLWTAGAEDARAGLTVSSIMVAEGDPPTVLGLINPLTDLFEALHETGAFVVHVLGRGQRRLAERFAGTFPSPGGRFSQDEWQQGEGGPVLISAAGRAYCELLHVQEAGYHNLVQGGIQRVELGAQVDPLVYLHGGFRRLQPRDAP